MLTSDVVSFEQPGPVLAGQQLGLRVLKQAIVAESNTKKFSFLLLAIHFYRHGHSLLSLQIRDMS